MLSWFFLLTLFSCVHCTEVSVFSYNLKGGRKGRQVCCWTSGPGKDDENHAARQWEMDKMKAEVDKAKYDFLSLVETRDEQSGYPGDTKRYDTGKDGCTKVTEILTAFPDYGAAKQSPWGWTCNTILYNKSKWKLDEEAQAQHWTCANSEIPSAKNGNGDDRVMAAARFSAASGEDKVVVVSIQYPHVWKPYPNGEYIAKIKELAENGKWPVILAGDMNMNAKDLEGRMGKSGWPAKASADLATCCADNGFDPGTAYDHIAVMADDKQGWTISVEANILPGWGKDDSYTFQKIKWQAKMSAEHLPVAGTVKFEKGDSGGGASPAEPPTDGVCGGGTRDCDGNFAPANQNKDTCTSRANWLKKHEKKGWTDARCKIYGEYKTECSCYGGGGSSGGASPAEPPADGVCGGGTRDCDGNFAPAKQRKYTCTSRANWVKKDENKSWPEARCKIYGEYKTECSCYYGKESHVAESMTIPIKVASAAKALCARLDVQILAVGVSVLVAVLLFLRAKKHAQNPGSYHALLDVDEEEI